MPRLHQERHLLDTPPYERVEVCPFCGAGDFFEFDFYVEKSEVAICLLPIITELNRYVADLKGLFGEGCDSRVLSNCIARLAELLFELFDYIPVSLERRILKCDSNSECESILMRL